MKICVATTAFPRWSGDGQGIFLYEAVRAIARQGVQIRVVAMHSPGAQSRESMDGIEVVRPRYWWPERWEFLRKGGQAGLPATWRKYPLARVQILPFAFIHTVVVTQCARDCDLVHAHWTLSAASAHLGRWIHRRRVLATVHGSDVFQVPRHPLGAAFTQATLRRCDRITAVSRALMEAVVELGVSPDRIQVISNGVDITRFCPSADEERQPIVLYVGSLIERKGVKYLVSAMPEVFRRFPDHRLLLLGDGPQYPVLKRLVDELGIAHRVTFAGFQPSEHVRDWMRRAQLLVLPSLEEAQGVVLLEALACGTPVVASRVHGIPEVVVPEVGILAPPADSAALSESISSVLGDARRYRRMSQNARERAVAQYGWDHVAKQFVALYEEMTTTAGMSERRER